MVMEQAALPFSPLQVAWVEGKLWALALDIGRRSYAVVRISGMACA